MYQINKLSKKLKLTYIRKNNNFNDHLYILQRSVTYIWLANVASCDAQTFFNNSIDFCSFDQDPQVQKPLQLINNCYITILVSEKENITIVSNKIEKENNNKNTKKIYYHYHPFFPFLHQQQEHKHRQTKT